MDTGFCRKRGTGLKLRVSILSGTRIDQRSVFGLYWPPDWQRICSARGTCQPLLPSGPDPVKRSSLLLTLRISGCLVYRLSWRIDTPLKHKTPPSFAEKIGALFSSIATNLPRSGFKTPSNVPWLRYEPLQNAHILPCMLRFFIGLRLALEPNLKFWNNL